MVVKRTPVEHSEALAASLVAALDAADGSRPARIARARRHVAERAFDHGDVVDEVAETLLLLSGAGAPPPAK